MFFLIYGDIASPAMMLLNARVPHSSYFMYNETESKAANSSLKVCWEPSDEALLGYRGTQIVRAFNSWYNYQHSG